MGTIRILSETLEIRLTPEEVLHERVPPWSKGYTPYLGQLIEWVALERLKTKRPRFDPNDIVMLKTEWAGDHYLITLLMKPVGWKERLKPT